MTQYQILKARTWCWCQIVQNYLFNMRSGSNMWILFNVRLHQFHGVWLGGAVIWYSHILIVQNRLNIWFDIFKWGSWCNSYLGFIFLTILCWTWILTRSWLCSNDSLFLCQIRRLQAWKSKRSTKSIVSICFVNVGMHIACSHKFENDLPFQSIPSELQQHISYSLVDLPVCEDISITILKVWEVKQI